MKLNAEQLVVSSFETAAPTEKLARNALGTQPWVCPTPATQCFVCPAPSSPEDGC
jgi:hypothetical protein